MTIATLQDNIRHLPPPMKSPSGAVLVVYHMGRSEVGAFAPLSHFGTLNAAFERLLQKDVLPNVAEGQENYLNGTSFYAVQLRIGNPLVVDDDFTWSSNGINADARKHFTSAEQAYIDDIKKMSDKSVRAELQQGEIYLDASTPEDNRKNLVRQRTIAVLEAKGYDSIAYVNRDEDIGSISWINFRPQQVESIYSGPMIDSPARPLPTRPRAWTEGIREAFTLRTPPPMRGLPLGDAWRWESAPEKVAEIADHFAEVEARLCAEQDVREIQFQAEIAIALYDPEYVAARVSNGDTAIAAFYERCQQRMSELAATTPEDLPSWQRAYLPEIKRAAGEIDARATTLTRAPASVPQAPLRPSF